MIANHHPSFSKNNRSIEARKRDLECSFRIKIKRYCKIK
jgi:hypothetical protein